MLSSRPPCPSPPQVSADGFLDIIIGNWQEANDVLLHNHSALGTALLFVAAPVSNTVYQDASGALVHATGVVAKDSALVAPSTQFPGFQTSDLLAADVDGDGGESPPPSHWPANFQNSPWHCTSRCGGELRPQTWLPGTNLEGHKSGSLE